jgi:hypothetical protein
MKMPMQPPNDTDFASAWGKIAQALANLRFGTVEITVHDGRIVQIERREKVRLDSPVAQVSAKSTPKHTPKSD